MSDYPMSSVDPGLAMQEATQHDLVRQKLDMDALRKRLGDGKGKEEKLREACEGFEAIFLQRMWEQMRKTVPKEGYLHSKDEEMYQSLFDVELCKKMAGAGGIGLADMLYEQLAQQLEDTGRTTTPGSYRRAISIAPPEMLAANGKQAAPLAEAADLRPETLYTPLAGQGQTAATSPLLEAAYAELGVSPAADAEPNAAQLWAMERDAMAGTIVPALPGHPAATGGSAGAVTPSVAAGGVDMRPQGEPLAPGSGARAAPGLAATGAGAPAAQATAGQAVGQAVGQATGQATVQATGQASGQAPGLTMPGQSGQHMQTASSGQSATAGAAPAATQAGSAHLFGKPKSSKSQKAPEPEKAAQPPRSMVPEGTLWPVADNAGTVSSKFGWEDDPATGKRVWNSGIGISTTPSTPVRAVLPGTVVYAGQRDGYGHSIVLEHRDGYRSYYSNLVPGTVKVGDQIRHGAEFAQVAAQPLASGNGENSASLYFELKKGEMAINPENAIRRLNAASS
ncbi:peptidoglycan DD-metalloendopeptidase family protein [Desulfovibrio sp. OttesenSCG-928-A18]|nr:peptidoglycan DD-metalloendopeptidase family protein [Desulfovibrio sp. OttesenSCG-928-A18]